jgi:hypothetical protein
MDTNLNIKGLPRISRTSTAAEFPNTPPGADRLAMSAAQRLLDRLDGVRSAGAGRWMARCPAHNDGRPSLSIREADGRVLVHCFAGCDTRAVLGALNLRLSDLFDAHLGHGKPPLRDRGHWHGTRAALEALRDEARIVAIVASDITNGRPIAPADADRVAVAAGRISECVRKLYGRPSNK